MRRSASLLVAIATVAAGCSLLTGQLGPSPSPGSSAEPTAPGTLAPTAEPTSEPTAEPTSEPTAEPTLEPTAPPTPEPTLEPTAPSPTLEPTLEPTPTPDRTPKPGFQPNKFDLKLVKIADNLTYPVYITSDGTGDERMYIVERAGVIRVLLPNGKIRTKPLLDLRGRVGTDGERGMHAVAFHPRFGRNGRFFVNYNTVDGDTNVVEYRMDDPDAEVSADSGRTIMRFSRPDWNHNGGWLGFGPDGYLYIASGDGGGSSPGDPFGNGQDRTDLLGSILRIDVDGAKPYGIPRDNPFADSGSFRRELWNYGMRNPWRASFDLQTGNLWIGDVGQDDWEEVDLQRAGKGGLNFGWSIMEGTACHRSASCDRGGLTLPVADYGHAKGCSIIGGYVYRGTQSPLLFGGYLFADYCLGTIWGIDAEGAKPGDDLKPRELLDTGFNWVSFGQDDAGEVYIVSFGGGIYHLVAKPK